MINRARVFGAVGALALLAACGESATSSTAPVSTTVSASTVSASTVTAASTSSTVVASIVNVWTAPPVDLTKLPLGDTHVSTSAPSVGGLYACSAGNP
ncbi:MAG: hypothetical protein RL219_49, partial [Actinomycetota bacterium]